jgi:hypothetical protein
MASPKTMISPEELEEFSYKYLEDCMNFKKEHPTASGRLVQITDRQIPTIDYFLRIWIPKQGKPTICRKTYYNWLNGEDELKLHTIKDIEGIFKALATDIVANDGKGIFYAKNRLGMTDKAQNDIQISNESKLPDWLTKPLSS